VAKILIVDDDLGLRRLVAAILRSEGFDADLADSAEAGLTYLTDGGPDLIILDINMPGMDGRAFYRTARNLGYAGPVVICSAYDATATWRELGAEAKLDKPFDPEELLDVIGGLLPSAAS
jgi:DNA-binding response OmpR family regulator